MDLYENTRKEKRQTFFTVIAIGLLAMVAAAPVVQAAAQRVKVVNTPSVTVTNPVRTVTAKVRDTSGDSLESAEVGSGEGNTLGILGAPGAEALAVRTFGGGGGLLGTGDCNVDQPAQGQRNNVVNVEPSTSGTPRVITAIIISGPDAAVTVSAPDLDQAIGAGPVQTFRTTGGDQNLFIGLGNGLTVTPSNLLFRCSSNEGGNLSGNGNFTVIGQ